MLAISLWQPYLAGVLHGDAWCSNLTIGLRCKDRDFSQQFAACINAGFARSVQPKRDERGYWLVRVGNKSGTFSALRAFVPKGDEAIAMWLRGLFDSEGNAQLWHMPHVSQLSYHRRVAFYSTAVHTLLTASSYLTALAIPNTLRPTKNSASHRGSKIVHELRVVRREGFTRFASVVGSSIGRKDERLKLIASTYQPAFDYQSRGGKAGTATRLARAAKGEKY